MEKEFTRDELVAYYLCIATGIGALLTPVLYGAVWLAQRFVF
jgi:hypothetical protein